MSFGFQATLWPTDKGIRSRSRFRVMVPLTFVRALTVSRAVAIELANMPVYVSRVGTMAHCVAASFIALAPWANLVLNVRGKNRWAYMRALTALSAGSMLAIVVLLRCTVLGPHDYFPPRMRGRGFPFQIAVARPSFVLALNALLTPVTRQAFASLADWMGLTHVPIQLSQIRTLTAPRDLCSLVQRLMSPSHAADPSSSDTPSARRRAQSESGVSQAGGISPAVSHHTAKLGGRDPASMRPAGAAYGMTPAAAPEVQKAPSEVPEAAPEVPAAAPEVPAAESEVPAAAPEVPE